MKLVMSFRRTKFGQRGLTCGSILIEHRVFHFMSSPEAPFLLVNAKNHDL